MSKHTPGPWRIGGSMVYAKGVDEPVAMGKYTKMGETDHESRVADTYLIAAAPDLLAALRPFADLLEDPDEYPDSQFEAFVDVSDIKAARAAIRKAEAQ